MSAKFKLISKGILAWSAAIIFVIGVIWGGADAYSRLSANDNRDIREHTAIRTQVEVLTNVASNTVLLMTVLTNDISYIRKNVDELKQAW